MNRFFKTFAVAAAGLAIVSLSPAPAWAACPGAFQMTQCANQGGGLQLAPSATQVGGTFWMVGQGLDVIGPGDTTAGFGNDAGGLAAFPIPVAEFDPNRTWLTDFASDTGGVPGLVCISWDWVNPGSDGCGDATTGAVLAAVLRDNQGNFAVMQVAGTGSFDFDNINNGGPGPAFPGFCSTCGVTLRKGVTVTSATDLGTTVGVTVAALNLLPGQTLYDDAGGSRALPGTVRLIERFGGVDTVKSAGPGGTTVTVAADSNVCWELVDAGYHVTLGCRAIGGNTPSQNVINGTAGFAKGGAKFSWDVTAQFDVLGFNIYQKNVSKGVDRKINDTLIGLSGDNDATAESYNYVAPRSDLRAWKGGFEIELVRQNGETSRAPVTLKR
jgi:hypothetical protein